MSAQHALACPEKRLSLAFLLVGCNRLRCRRLVPCHHRAPFSAVLFYSRAVASVAPLPQPIIASHGALPFNSRQLARGWQTVLLAPSLDSAGSKVPWRRLTCAPCGPYTRLTCPAGYGRLVHV